MVYYAIFTARVLQAFLKCIILHCFIEEYRKNTRFSWVLGQLTDGAFSRQRKKMRNLADSFYHNWY